MTNTACPSASPGAKTAQSCPVALMGFATAAITDEITRLQEDRTISARDQENRERHLIKRKEALEALACFEVAKSLDGVMFQVMVLNSLADPMTIRNDAAAEWAESQIESVTHAIARFLEGMGADRRRVNGDYYLSRDHDPHAAASRCDAA